MGAQSCPAASWRQNTGMSKTGVPRINGVIETILYVDDLPQGVAFYRDIMGLEPMIGDPATFQSFDSGGGRVLLLFKRGGTLTPTPVPGGIIPPHDGHGPLHIAFAIGTEAYTPWKARLLEQGVTIESETQWERGGRSLFFRDSAGHLVELVTPGIWPIY